jgi:hypothetical protein
MPETIHTRHKELLEAKQAESELLIREKRYDTGKDKKWVLIGIFAILGLVLVVIILMGEPGTQTGYALVDSVLYRSTEKHAGALPDGFEASGSLTFTEESQPTQDRTTTLGLDGVRIYVNADNPAKIYTQEVEETELPYRLWKRAD